MSQSINSHNNSLIIDESVGSGGIYKINGHNNKLKIQNVEVTEIIIMGHNNTVIGVGDDQVVCRLVVLGHNNRITDLTIDALEVMGHNNTMKNLQLCSEPTNSGHNNKFSRCGQLEDPHEYEYEQQQHEQVFEGHEYEDMAFNIQCQVQKMLNGLNIGEDFMNFNLSTSTPSNVFVNHYEQFDDSDSSDSSDDSENDESEVDEEEKYYGNEQYPEEEDEEAHISPAERADIINSISSYAYHRKAKDEEENCAVCISKIENGQQVKSLACKHLFHPKCINDWLKRKLTCPCCKAKVTIN